jgi:hypothetical protein
MLVAALSVPLSAVAAANSCNTEEKAHFQACVLTENRKLCESASWCQWCTDFANPTCMYTGSNCVYVASHPTTGESYPINFKKDTCPSNPAKPSAPHLVHAKQGALCRPTRWRVWCVTPFVSAIAGQLETSMKLESQMLTNVASAKDPAVLVHDLQKLRQKETQFRDQLKAAEQQAETKESAQERATELSSMHASTQKVASD